MANIACQLPGVADATMYDVGRTLALWVSAFEILAHPGRGKSDLAAVYGLFDRLAFHDRNVKAKRYFSFDPNRKKMSRGSLARWVYYELYRARNDFLHSNPVEPARLRPTGSRTNLLNLASPLYRLALSGFLSLAFSEPKVPASDAAGFVARHLQKSDFDNFQHLCERGLLRARKTDRRLQRQRRRFVTTVT
jgi:hypothetical protein